jgi:hypothetical protein
VPDVRFIAEAALGAGWIPQPRAPLRQDRIKKIFVNGKNTFIMTE